MSELRTKMIKEMDLRDFAPSTQESYLYAVSSLAVHYNKSPDKIKQGEIDDYFLYLKNDKNLESSTRNVAVCGLRFLYKDVLHDDSIILSRPRRRKVTKLPKVLSEEEVRNLIDSADNQKHRLVLLVGYSAGLRVSEAISLKPEHIDSKRMMITIEQSKGYKDRYDKLQDGISWWTH